MDHVNILAIPTCPYPLLWVPDKKKKKKKHHQKWRFKTSGREFKHQQDFSPSVLFYPPSSILMPGGGGGVAIASLKWWLSPSLVKFPRRIHGIYLGERGGNRLGRSS